MSVDGGWLRLRGERTVQANPTLTSAVRITLGSVAYLRAANSGYGIGLDEQGHRVEFLGDRHVLALPAAAMTLS